MRGDWLKICTASHSRSTARSTAFGRPPALETWAPISIGAPRYCPDRDARPLRSVARPAPCTSAGPARPCSTGCSPAAPTARWCSGSRTPTASARRPRTSSRSSTRSSGSESTTTARPCSSPAADRHAEIVRQLIDGGHAYRSTAGPDEVKAWREQHGNRRLPRHGRGHGRRAPARARRRRDDRARRHPGGERFRNALQDDLVIARADGTPVYHTAVVVDDLDAGITHVVRGADHYSNTPKQLLILAALGERAAGVRAPAAAARAGRQEALQAPRRGVRAGAARRRLPAGGRAQLPRAARLGPARGEESFFTTEELQQAFALERVSRSPAIFDEQKLRWMNGRYLRELSVEDLQQRLEGLLGRRLDREVVAISQEKISKFYRRCTAKIGPGYAGTALRSRSGGGRNSGDSRRSYISELVGRAGGTGAGGSGHRHIYAAGTAGRRVGCDLTGRVQLCGAPIVYRLIPHLDRPKKRPKKPMKWPKKKGDVAASPFNLMQAMGRARYSDAPVSPPRTDT